VAQQLQEVYANVLEFDAMGDGSGDQTANLRRHRALGSGNTHLVLRQLLFDLAALGVIKVT
jgi:hypothetical protein